MTQHVGVAVEPEPMYELLRAAWEFGGEAGYRDSITQRIVELGVLTPNVREDAGRAQSWRDYQQVLAELGLIISTALLDDVVVTPVGMMYLDGAIGHGELITTQCLRYQYPNGQKMTLSSHTKRLLASAQVPTPESRVELDARYGVLIKPAVLLARAA